MKVIFNGLLEKKRGSGCNCKRRTSEYSFVRSKRYMLPSGVMKTFYVGQETEVSAKDGNFLLSYKVTDKNGTRSVFTKVSD